MFKVNAFLAGLFLLLGSVKLISQEDGQPGLVTDRPDLTESAYIIPTGKFQIETGFIFEGDKEQNVKEENFSLFTTLFRYGVNDYFELRLGSSLNRQKTTIDSESENYFGISYVEAGMKIEMVEAHGNVPQIAFLTHVIIPESGKKEFAPGYLTPSLALAVDHELSDIFSLGYNLGVVWNGINAKTAGKYSAALGIGFSEKLGGFIETYGYFPQDEQGINILDLGLTYLIKNNLQIDVSGGIGLSRVAPDYFGNAGMSWRIPN